MYILLRQQNLIQKNSNCHDQLNGHNPLFFRLSQSAGAALQIVYDLGCGVVSGWSQVFIMQPFEIIKIRLANQSLKQPDYLGIVDCFKKIKVAQGLAAFYRGTLSPLLGVGPQVALQFASNELIKKTLLKLGKPTTEGELPSISVSFGSGFLSGIPSALAATPVDLTRIQMQRRQGNKQFQGSMDAARKIYRNFGLRSLYLGFYPTLLRQTLALSCFFGLYDQGMRMVDPATENATRQTLSWAFWVGGIAGAASWLVTYPIDYIKTVVQSQSMKNKEYKSAIDCCMKKYREQGIKTFYKGLGVTMLRSFPVSGCGFAVFETLKKCTAKQDACLT